jgi:hypothetical protein
LAICARKYGGDEVEIDHPFDLNFEYRPPALVGPQPDLALQAPGSGKLLAFRSSAHIFSTSSMADSIARHDRIRTTSLRRNRIDLPQCHSHVAPELSGGFEQLRKGPRVVAAVASSGCSSQILPCRQGFTNRSPHQLSIPDLPSTGELIPAQSVCSCKTVGSPRRSNGGAARDIFRCPGGDLQSRLLPGSAGPAFVPGLYSSTQTLFVCPGHHPFRFKAATDPYTVCMKR